MPHENPIDATAYDPTQFDDPIDTEMEIADRLAEAEMAVFEGETE